jgi:hypothetical protein
VGQATLLRARVERAAGRLEKATALAREASNALSDNLSQTHPLRLEAEALASQGAQSSTRAQ